jgi:hypothetical protein
MGVLLTLLAIERQCGQPGSQAREQVISPHRTDRCEDATSPAVLAGFPATRQHSRGRFVGCAARALLS